MSEIKETITYLRDLKPTMKKVTSEFMVLELVQTHKTKDGNEVRTFKVADKTGSIYLTVWDNIGSIISPADIFRLNGGQVILRSGQLLLNMSRNGNITKIGEYCFQILESPNYSLTFDDSQIDLTNTGKRFISK